jgi:DNA-binding NtrC family response regulator
MYCILNALANAGSNITQAAEHLNISRGTLYRLMEKFDINWPGRTTEEAQENDNEVSNEIRLYP